VKRTTKTRLLNEITMCFTLSAFISLPLLLVIRRRTSTATPTTGHRNIKSKDTKHCAHASLDSFPFSCFFDLISFFSKGRGEVEITVLIFIRVPHLFLSPFLPLFLAQPAPHQDTYTHGHFTRKRTTHGKIGHTQTHTLKVDSLKCFLLFVALGLIRLCFYGFVFYLLLFSFSLSPLCFCLLVFLWGPTTTPPE